MQRLDVVAEGLSRLIPARGLSIFAVDPRLPFDKVPADRGVIRGFELDSLLAYANHYRHVDPMGDMLLAPAWRPARLSERVQRGRFGRDAFTGEFLPRHGLRHVLAVVAETPDGVRLGVALHGGPRHDFTEAHREALRLVARDLALAAAGALAREDALARLRGGSPGAMVTDAAGRPLHADPLAMTLLDELGEEGRSDLAAHASAVAGRGEGATSTRAFALGGRAVAARASCFRISGASHALVVLTDAGAGDAHARPDAAVALTPRERQVARLIVQGLTNREIAHRLGISPATVSIHVTRVLRKRGARGRVDLVRDALARGQPEAGSPPRDGSA